MLRFIYCPKKNYFYISNHLYRQSGYSTKKMVGASLRADVTDISSYWLWILSALPPAEWRNGLNKLSQDVAFLPLPFPPLLLSRGHLLQCQLASPKSNLVTVCPGQLLGEVSTSFLSLALLLSSQPWAESICCAENLANLNSFSNANQNWAYLEQFTSPS